MKERRIPTGIEVRNGMLHLGDRIRYDDGWLCFEAVVVFERGVVGFYHGDDFLCLRDFIRNMTVFLDEKGLGAAEDFEIIN